MNKPITRYDSGDIWEVYEGYASLNTIEGADGDWCKASDVDELINKLKCCGNCKHALTMSQMGLYNTRPCKDCINESLWEMEDYK